MKHDRLLSALAMSRGAGKLQIGFDAAAAAAEKGAPLVVLASDAAERTRRNLLRCCGEGTAVLELKRTKNDIEDAVGRRFAVAAVTDESFAKLIKQTHDSEREAGDQKEAFA